jgi:hypothetical protein
MQETEKSLPPNDAFSDALGVMQRYSLAKTTHEELESLQDLIKKTSEKTAKKIENVNQMQS